MDVNIAGQSVPSSPQSSPPTLKRCMKSASDLGNFVAQDSRKRGVQMQQPLSPTRSPTNSKLKSRSTIFYEHFFFVSYTEYNRIIFRELWTKSGEQVLL